MRPVRALLTLISLTPLALAGACGGSDQPTGMASGTTTGSGGAGGAGGATTTTTTTTSGMIDAGSDADNGAPSDVYPAPHPPAPKVVTYGGPVLKAPSIVPVFFSNDGAAIKGKITDFLSKVGATSYWAAVTAEYGVGPATSSPPIELAEAAPGMITDAQIQTWLAGKLNGDDPAFPVADGNTVVEIHYPKGTTIKLGNGAQAQTSCVYFGGYHSNIVLDAAHGKQKVAYAVIPRCDNFDGFTGIDAVTAAASHELIEAATDPYPQTAPAYQITDNSHLYWALSLGGELGDMCAFGYDVFTTFPELDYVVQRSWSNKAAAAGHDPCQPVLGSDAYFNAVPVYADTVNLDLGGGSIHIKGAKIAVGDTKTIDVALFSDADTGGPFTVEALDESAFFGGASRLSFSWDRDSGVNGEKLHLTIEVLDGSPTNNEFFYLISTLGNRKSMWIGVVGNE